MRAAFLFDPDRCTACEACRVACGIENNEGRDTGWRTVLTFNPARHPALPTRHLSLACNHCESAPCASGCPAAAYSRDAITGAVLLDPAKCIGCRYCSWLCPYDAPAYDEDRGVMTKCTFCAPRLANGGQPACTAACPTGALSFGAHEDVDAEPSFPGLGTFGIGPALRIETPRRTTPPPALAIDDLVLDVPAQPRAARKITVRSEWALLVFTIVMPALVAWFGGGIARPERRPPLLAFVAIGAAMLALSTLHLGKPLRAWRAILNVRTSWLSREILFANLFLVSGAAFLAFPERAASLSLLSLACGIALTFSIDAVYRAVPLGVRAGRPHSQAMHSADATLSFLLLFGIAAGLPIVTIPAALVKFSLFAGRWWRGEAGVPVALGAIRVVLLVAAAVPAIAWLVAFALALVGEVIDRAAFYSDIEPTTPAQRVQSEMRAAGAAR